MWVTPGSVLARSSSTPSKAPSPTRCGSGDHRRVQPLPGGGGGGGGGGDGGASGPLGAGEADRLGEAEALADGAAEESTGMLTVASGDGPVRGAGSVPRVALL